MSLQIGSALSREETREELEHKGLFWHTVW